MLALVWSLLVFGVLAALAAWATEQARWLLGASRRLPWLVALIATAAWPLIQANIGQFMLSSPTTATIQLPAVVIVSQAARIAATSRPWLAQGLVVLWGLASLVLLARLVRAARAATSALHYGRTRDGRRRARRALGRRRPRRGGLGAAACALAPVAG